MSPVRAGREDKNNADALYATVTFMTERQSLKATDPSGLRQALCSDQWFSGCSSGFQKGLLALAQVRHFDDGQAVYGREALPHSLLLCVLSGAVSVHSHLSDGRPSLLVYLQPHHWFGELPLIDGRPRGQDAFAVGETALLCVPLASLQHWLDMSPGVAGACSSNGWQIAHGLHSAGGTWVADEACVSALMVGRLRLWLA